MAVFVVPTPDDGYPARSQRTSLDGVAYELTFLWNERQGAWFLSIADAEGAPILMGARILVDHPLLGSLRDARRPPGELVALDMSDQQRDPGIDDFGTRVMLVYLDREELNRD